LGVDDMNLYKGIGLKFLALLILSKDNENFRGSVVLVHTLNPTRSSGKDIQNLKYGIKYILNKFIIDTYFINVK